MSSSSNNSKNYFKDFDLLAALALCVFIGLRILFIQYSDHKFRGDLSLRISDIIQWAKSPEIIFAGDWLPGHKYLYGTVYLAFGNNLAATRYFSVFLSVIGAVHYYLLVHQFFNKRVALASLSLLTLFFVQVRFDTYAMAMTPYFVCVFSSFYLIRKYVSSENAKYFYLSIVVNLIGSSFRYEYWIFIPFLASLIFFKNKNWKTTIDYLAISSLFILYWMVASYLTLGDFLFGINSGSEDLKNFLLLRVPHLSDRLLLIPKITIESLGVVTVGLIVLGLFYSIIKRRWDMYLLFPLYIFAPLQIKLINFSLNINPRYFSLLAVALLPYSVVVFNLNKKVRTMLILCFLLIFAHYNSGIFKQDNIDGNTTYSADLKDVAGYILAENASYFFDSGPEAYETMIANYASIPREKYHIVSSWIATSYSQQEFENDLISKRFSRLVTHRQGKVRKILGGGSVKFYDLPDFSLSQIYENDTYRIYEVHIK